MNNEPLVILNKLLFLNLLFSVISMLSRLKLGNLKGFKNIVNQLKFISTKIDESACRFVPGEQYIMSPNGIAL